MFTPLITEEKNLNCRQ